VVGVLKRAAVVMMAMGLVGVAPALAATTSKAKFGKSLTLHGIQASEKMLVHPSALRIVAPGQFESVPSGKRLVGVNISLKNTGQAAYSDAPSNSTKLVTTAGKVIGAVITESDECKSPGSVNVPRGQKRSVCIAFLVPKSAHLRYLKFALNSGYANQVGQWGSLPTPR
jgi:hypothetical protein